MPWTKTSDDALTHPRMTSIAAREDLEPVWVPAAFGFYQGLVTLTAAHLTDGIVGFGECILAAFGDRTTAWHLIEIAERAGLMEPIDAQDEEAPQKWQLLKDVEFVDYKHSWQVENDRQRKRDNRDEALTAAVRHRDGDCCRWCGVSVEWNDRRGARGATYDHIRRGDDITADDLVVSCRSCNSKRNDGDANGTNGIWLLPVPSEPKYTDSTRQLWERKGWALQHGLVLPPKDKGQQMLPLTHSTPSTFDKPGEVRGRSPHPVDDRARSRQVAHEPPQGSEGEAPGEVRGRSPHPVDGRARSRQVAHEPPQEQKPKLHNPDLVSIPDPDPRADRSGLSGSGRVWSGRAGSGRNRSVQRSSRKGKRKR